MLIQNRRGSIRMGTMIRCGLRAPGWAGQDSWGVILDFSLNGVLLKSYFRFASDQAARISFSIQDRYRFEDVHSRIVWVRHCDDYELAGVEFDSSLSRDRIRAAMRFMIDPSAE